MTALLELRENLKKIYSRNEAFILPVIKFLLSFIVLSIINGKMGYMTKLDNMAIVLIVSLLCSFLPTGFMAFFAMMFAVLHMYALSIEPAAVGLVVFLLLYLLFLRFTAKEALVVVLTPVLCMLKLPYVMPVAMGLIGTPASCVSVGCGVVVYYLLQTVITNAPTINSMGAEEATAKLRLLIDGMLGNKAMLVTIAAFAITVIVVYLIRRMSVDHSWTIAMVAGVMIEVMILLVGDLMYDTNLSIVSALLGTRSYKEAYSKDKTLSILQEQAETGKINREIVSILEEHFDEILAEVATNCSPILHTYYGLQQEYEGLLEKHRGVY